MSQLNQKNVLCKIVFHIFLANWLFFYTILKRNYDLNFGLKAKQCFILRIKWEKCLQFVSIFDKKVEQIVNLFSRPKILVYH